MGSLRSATRPRPHDRGGGSFGPSTYSIVGADPEANECGVAVQSKFLAVGAFVPFARGGVGAVATQAFANITYGPRGLDLLEEGMSPEETIAAMTGDDEMSAHRQVGVVAADGRSGSFTGAECYEHAVSATGDGFAAQGNILTAPGVVDAMGETFAATAGPLAVRLLEALDAGERAGGEKRGMESAALVVVRPGGGYGGNNDRWLDLRVDHDDSPIDALRGLLDLHTLYFGSSDPADLLAFDADLRAEVIEILDRLGWGEPGDDVEQRIFSWVGWHNLEERWRGMDRLDPLVLRELRAVQPDPG